MILAKQMEIRRKIDGIGFLKIKGQPMRKFLRIKINVLLQTENRQIKSHQTAIKLGFLFFKTVIDNRIQKRLSLTIFPLKQGLR
ncbi:MAG: hypothetical protein JXR34_09750, partial [Bacteroidales bacterium]|nr:hypothetical protein [Bacteroidales bacterium]